MKKIFMILLLAYIPIITKAQKNYTQTVNKVNFKMVAVEGGTFTMNCINDNGDCHRGKTINKEVKVNSFLIAETEVTQKLWRAVMGKDPDHL
jgi:formylglycine-generating enzyme required for sulfatase activity